MDEHYTYRSLPNAATIRLLVLQPSDRAQDDYIWQGEIDETPFEALSYTWGSERSKVRVKQDGAVKWIEVSDSLGPILESLRYADVPRRLWVDALCINQRDVEERNRVVPRMREIYSRATTVVISLGPENFYSQFIPHTLLAIHDSLADYDHLNGFAKLDERLQAVMEARGIPCSDPDELAYRWKTFRSWLYDRRWFRRMWVLQEAAVARKSLVCCAGWQMTGTSFFQTMGMLSRCPLPRQIAEVVDGFDFGVRAAIQQIGLMRSLGAGKETLEASPLMDLLARSRGAGATDAHDHIYALLGLSSDEGLPEVDYAQPWQETYRQFAVYLIEHGRVADVLQNCFLADGLPTWVPDWSALQEIYGDRGVLNIPYHTPGIHTAGYAAGGKQPASFAFEGEVLRVRGVLAMKIVTMGQAFGNPLMGADAADAARIVMEALHELYNLTTAPDARVLDLLAWQTLLCGQNWDTNRPFEANDLHVCYPYVAQNASVLDAMEETGLPTGSKRGQQLVSRLAFDEYKAWKQTPPPPPPHDAMRRFERKAVDFCITHRRCVSDAGLLGQVPRKAMEGDIVAIIQGVPVPLVLREAGPAYSIIGPSYFASIMGGNVMEILADKVGMIPLA